MDDQAIRLYLHNLLIATFPDLTGKIYYRPPGNLLLVRPCIVYTDVQAEMSYANNSPYVIGTRFQITILSNIPGYTDSRKLLNVPTVNCTDNESYVTEDVVHDVFRVVVNKI